MAPIICNMWELGPELSICQSKNTRTYRRYQFRRIKKKQRANHLKRGFQCPAMQGGYPQGTKPRNIFISGTHSYCFKAWGLSLPGDKGHPKHQATSNTEDCHRKIEATGGALVLRHAQLGVAFTVQNRIANDAAQGSLGWTASGLLEHVMPLGLRIQESCLCCPKPHSFPNHLLGRRGNGCMVSSASNGLSSATPNPS